MKVVHIIKKIETIDMDIKELRKLEKSLEKNKSFSQPIFMTIEKQVNILLAERIKCLELEIKNPPEAYVKDIEGDAADDKPIPQSPFKSHAPKKGVKEKKAKEPKAPARGAARAETKIDASIDDDDIPVPMLTQDDIDRKFKSISADNARMKKEEKPAAKNVEKKEEKAADEDDTDVKLLDVALSTGTLTKQEISTEKKRIRFFRDNFPGGEY